MSFTSLVFLFFFLPLSLIICIASPKKVKNPILLILSLLFYSWGEPVYVLLMIAMSIFAFFAGKILGRDSLENEDRKFALVLSVVVSIAGLMFFKYYPFLINNINMIFRSHLQIRELPLPLGISFFTFKQLSYLFDVYYKKVEPETNIIDLALYISIFPQVGAGPIVQYSDMKDELKDRNENIILFGFGVEKFILGLGKKVIIANNLALMWSEIKAMNGNVSVATAWLGIIAFTLQIYFDFSGYSDMAIGIGNMLGFNWKPNFNYPYISTSIRDFWRRWHISLGSWFRDYIYIPLGGNRKGIKKEIRNMFIVWAITGLWHGASWNFILWGLYFGVLIFFEKVFFGRIQKVLPKVVKVIITMFLVVIGWVMFDLNSVSGITSYLKAMFGMNRLSVFADSYTAYMFGSYKFLLIFGIIGATPVIYNFIKNVRLKLGKKGRIAVAIYYGLIVVLSTAMLVGESYSPFLYFKF